jgi:hypothetical protein
VPHLQVPREADVPVRAVEYWLCSLAATLTHGWESVVVVESKKAQGVDLRYCLGDMKAAASKSAVVAWSEHYWEVVLDVE